MLAMRLKNIIFGVVMLAIGAFLLSSSYSTSYSGAEMENGPMFFPQILLWLWVALSVGIIIEDLRKNAPIVQRQQVGTLLLVMALVGAACVLLSIVGFIPVCFVFFAGYGYVLKFRNLPILFLISAAFTVLIWAVFNYALQISLPEVPFFVD